jgi:hypothetical protein
MECLSRHVPRSASLCRAFGREESLFFHFFPRLRGGLTCVGPNGALSIVRGRVSRLPDAFWRSIEAMMGTSAAKVEFSSFSQA